MGGGGQPVSSKALFDQKPERCLFIPCYLCNQIGSRIDFGDSTSKMNFALSFLSITVLSISATPFGRELAAPVKASEFGGKAIETVHGEEDWRKLEEASKAPAARRQLPASGPHPCWMHLANLRPPRPYSTLVVLMTCGSTVALHSPTLP